MTLTEFTAAFKTLGMPIAYGAFKEPTSPPFITYQMDDDDDFHADNSHYYNIDNGLLELYTIKKDEATEKLIEDKFEELGLPYSKISETWISEERMLQVVWGFQKPE